MIHVTGTSRSTRYYEVTHTYFDLPSSTIRLDIVGNIVLYGRTNDNEFVSDFVAVEIVEETIARVIITRRID